MSKQHHSTVLLYYTYMLLMLSNLHILYLLTFFYTALLILPSTSLAPTIIIRLSFLFTVVLPVLFILYTVVATHAHASSTSTSTPTKHSPAWIPGVHGALANHNFCEADHVYSGYYVEFFNTFSSLPIIFYGGVGPYYTRKYASKELRFACSFISIGAVGVGSALFHGTMLRFGQVLDEVPMLCIIFAGIYCFVEDAETSKYGVWFPFVLVAACISLVAGYLVFYMYSLFLLAFSSGVVLLLIRGVVVVQRAPALSSFILKICFVNCNWIFMLACGSTFMCTCSIFKSSCRMAYWYRILWLHVYHVLVDSPCECFEKKSITGCVWLERLWMAIE